MKNSNARIKKYEDELDRFAKVMPINEMSYEEFLTYYPQLENNDLVNPMNWPEVPKGQETLDEILFWKKRGTYYPFHDETYFPNIEEDVKKMEAEGKLPAHH